MTVEAQRSRVGSVMSPRIEEPRSQNTTWLGLLTQVWGAVWAVVGLFLIVNDLAGLDWLWGGTSQSGGVGVLVASTGAWAVVLGFAITRVRAWTHDAALITYTGLVMIGLSWLFSFLGSGTSLIYGLIHLPMWAFGLFLASSVSVRNDLHGVPPTKLAKTLGSVGAAGLIFGLLFTFSGEKIVTTMVGVVLSIAIAGAIFVGINKLFDLARINYQLFMATGLGLVGAVVGGLVALNSPPLGGMPTGIVTMLVAIGIFAGIGWVRGRTVPPPAEVTKLIEKARIAIFVSPALIFIFVSLVIPTIRTVFLSFLNKDSENFVGFDNYTWVFTSDSFFSVSGWSGIFGSSMTLWGVILLAAALGVAAVYGRRRGAMFEFGGSLPSGLAVVGGTLILFAVFTSLRGAIWNNLWWVFAVTVFSTALGLLVAVLADRVKYESAAKALIFLPMAISMVGAGVIWKFVYDFSTRGDQVGLLNGIWQAFGNDPVFWIGQRPWNNFLLIIVMIWIQTGFAMVVLSAALKGVPTDQVEAARVDGATEVDIFWRVTVPTIRSTIAVVVTTLIILVMKVYDIVKVMTNGEFGTEVLANAMFNQAFTFVSFGRGSALATILFLAVLPMMYINIRRVRQEQAIR